MGLNKKLRSLEQTRTNLSHLLQELELPKIKMELKEQWEKEQLEKENKVQLEKKNTGGRVSKVVRKILGLGK